MNNIKIFIKFFSLSLLTAVIAILLWQSVLYLSQNRQAMLQSLSATLSAKPEAFTELYFEDNENLPTKITNDTQFLKAYPTMALFTFRFTIHNKEGKDMTYPFDVYEIVDGEKTHIDIGTIYVKKDETKTISESFSALKIFPKTEVVVSLPEKNQQISFWMEIKK